ncbi:hypothetical protein AVEN_82298-1, partial [Araneus ventricosus]
MVGASITDQECRWSPSDEGEGSPQWEWRDLLYKKRRNDDPLKFSPDLYLST